MRIERILVALLFSGSILAQDSPLVAAAKSTQRERTLFAVSQPAPNVRTIRWFNSEATSLERLRGRVVLVDFWATWCGPCVSAFPEIQRLAKELGSSGFTAVLIHARHTKTPDSKDVVAESVVPAYIQQHRITLPVAIADQNEFETLGIRGIPHYVLIDRQGVVRYSRAGRLPDAATIRALLRDEHGAD